MINKHLMKIRLKDKKIFTENLYHLKLMFEKTILTIKV